jgi:phosphate transport system permease protein
MPIQIFNWTSRPDAAFHNNAAAASFVLVLMTLGMNAIAIWLRYRLRKNIKW